MRIRTFDRPLPATVREDTWHCRRTSCRRRAATLLAAAVAAPALAWPLVASAQTWTANFNGSWSLASNWTSLPVSNPSTQLFFAAVNSDSFDALDDFAGPFDVQSLSYIGTSSGTLSVSTSPISALRFAPGGSLINSSTSNTVLNGRLKIGGGLNVNQNTAGTGMTINGVLAGSSSVTFAGGGSVILNGQNAFTGPVNLNGRVDFGTQTAFGSGTIVANAGTIGGAMFVSAAGAPPYLPVIANAIDNSAGGGLNLGGLFGYTLGGNITGAAPLNLRPSNLFNSTWTLAGDNTGFTGAVNVFASPTANVTDTLVFNGAAAVGGTSTISINAANARLAFVGGASPIIVNAPLVVAANGAQLSAQNVTTTTNVTYAGQLNGSANSSLTRVGNGYVTFTADNSASYFGTMNLAGGFTAANTDANLGVASGSVLLNTGDLVLNPGFGSSNRPIVVQSSGSPAPNPSTIFNFDDVTYGGNLSSAGSQAYQKSGAGRLTLTASNAFVGSITVNSGTLAASGALGTFVGIANTGSIIVNQGGTLSFDSTAVHRANRVSTGTTTQFNVNGGGLELLGNGTVNSALNTGTNAVGTLIVGTSSNSGQGLNVVRAVPGAGANALMRFAGLSRTTNNGSQVLYTGLNLGTNSVVSQGSNSSNVGFATTPALVNGIFPYAIADATGGPGTDFATYDVTNGVRPYAAYVATLDGGATSNAAVTSASPAGSLNVSINSLKLLGGAVSSTGGITVASGGVLAVGAPSTISGGTLTLGTNGSVTGNIFAIADLNISSVVNIPIAATLNSGISKSGPGVLTLSNAGNNYSGPTRVLSGIMRSGAANVIPNTANGTSSLIINPGATYDFNGFADTLGSLQQAGYIDTISNGPVPSVLLGAASVSFGNDNLATAYAGEIAGTGTFLKGGFGTLTVIGSQSFTGQVTVTAGTLAIGAHLTRGTGFANAARLNVGTSNAGGDANLVFNFGVNNYSVPINVNVRAGSLASIRFAPGAGSLGGAGAPGMNLASNITILNNLTIDADGGQTISGVIGGAGSLGLTTTSSSGVLQNGPATFALNITGNNTYTGPTTLAAISTLWGNSNAFGAASTDIALGSTGGIDTPELSSSVGGATLSRAITLSDSTNIVPTFGIVGSRAPANGGTTTYSGRITIAGQRNRLILYSQNAGAPVTYSGPIGGNVPSANVQVGYSLGTGLEFVNSNVTLSGANSYAGGTRLMYGTLNLGRDSVVSAGSIATITSGPVGTGTLYIGASGGAPGSTEPTITGISILPGTRTLHNPIAIDNNFRVAGPNPLVLNGPVDLDAGARIISLGNTSPVTMNGAVTGATGAALIKDGPGNLTIAGSATYAGPTAVWAGTLTFTGPQTLGGALYVNGGGNTTVAAAGNSTLAVPNVSVDTAGTSQLDLNDNEMIVDYAGASPLASVTAQLKSGFNGAAWTGPGIMSSLAANAAATAAVPRTALGIIEASDTGSTTFAGKSVDNTSLLVRYTAAGDADLNGTVDLTDFTFLAANFNGSGKRWFNGDFNYDGTVDLTDFTFLAGNFNTTVPGASGSPASLGTTVPEPATIGLVIMLASTTLTARRRRR